MGFYTHSHTLTLINMHTHTHMRTHVRTSTLVLRSRSPTLSLSRTQPYSLTFSLSHTQTHTCIQDGGCIFFRCKSVRCKLLLLWAIDAYVKEPYMHTKKRPTCIHKRAQYTHVCTRKRALCAHKSEGTCCAGTSRRCCGPRGSARGATPARRGAGRRCPRCSGS